MKTSDFLVIGAGVAGLSFALRAAEHGKVAVITKGKFLDCSSAKAQGGIAAVWDRNDSFEDHVADTLDAGAGLCNEQAVRTIVEEGPDAIRELLEWGVNFDPGNQGEDYELAREGGHTKRRILHAKDATGLEITSKLLEAAKLHPNIELLEDHFAIDLITTTKLGLVTEDRVLGAYVLDRVSGEVEIFRSDRVLLATGGCGRVYLYTTNNDSATGDGVAMAWRAGATIANMEFVQFHPTCFFNTRAEGAEARSFLISEAVRGEGGVLTDVNGQTSLDGLYAAGETGCTGLHGANRLASNSLLECVVVAKRALNSMLSLHPLRKDSPTPYDIPAWHHGDTALPDELSVIYHNWDEIRRLMWDYVSIVRTNKRLDRAATRLRMLHREVKDFYWGYRITPDILELRNLVAVASLIVDCAMRRNESRGLHFNTDYPGKLDHRFVTQLHRW